MAAPQFGAALLTGLLALATLASCNTEGDILYTQRQKWKDPNGVLESWDPTLVNPCTWFHVTCNSDNSVIRVDLGNAGLSGALVPELGGLKNLQYLELYANNISGPIPATLANLTSLVSLDLYSNLLSGEIPTSLGAVGTLRYLYESCRDEFRRRLYENKLTGSIPASLGRLTKLANLELQENALTGSIPAALGNITTLQFLRLNGNILTGTVPLEILSLVLVGDLAELNVRRNNLAGTVSSNTQRVSKIIQDTVKTAN